MGGKLYEVVNIDFGDLTIEGVEASPKLSDLAEELIFPIEDFEDFKVTLRNKGGNVVDFGEWVEGHGKS